MKRIMWALCAMLTLTLASCGGGVNQKEAEALYNRIQNDYGDVDDVTEKDIDLMLDYCSAAVDEMIKLNGTQIDQAKKLVKRLQEEEGLDAGKELQDFSMQCMESGQELSNKYECLEVFEPVLAEISEEGKFNTKQLNKYDALTEKVEKMFNDNYEWGQEMQQELMKIMGSQMLGGDIDLDLDSLDLEGLE